MKSRIIFSPFMAYCFSFLVVIPIYFLNWSYLFPSLTLTLLFFFTLTFSMAIIGAMFFKNLISFNYQKQTDNNKDVYAALLVLFYLLEFLYARQIPLFSLLNNIEYIKILESFGIPTFHVFVLGYTAFITVFFFHCYLSQKKKKFLFYYCTGIILSLLIVSRITVTFVFIASIYIYLMSIKTSFGAKILKIGLIVILFFAGFGLIGNLRTANDINASEFILDVSEAKPSFRQSGIPDSYFWAYMYIASPIANLQLNINRQEVAFTKNNLFQFVIHEFLWDAVSKRIDSKYDYDRTNITQINSSYNVGSVFSRAYVYLGLWGMFLMFFFIFILTIFFLFTLNTRSNYFITYLACFNTIIVLCIFDNIFSFTPLSIILVFPIIEKIKHFFIKRTPANG